MGVANYLYEIELDNFKMGMFWGGVEMLHICRRMLTLYSVGRDSVRGVYFVLYQEAV